MIKVNIYKDVKGFYTKFTVDGHSGYGNEGSDIICSAVSALAQTSIGAIDELTDAKIKYFIDDNSGYLECEIVEVNKPEQRETIRIILKTLEIGVIQIINSYGNKYIKINVHQM